MEDIFKEQEGDRVSEIKRVEEEIKQRKGLLEKATSKLITDEIDKKDIQTVKASIEKELFSLTSQVSELKDTESGFGQYLKYGFTVLSVLKRFYLKTKDVAVKQKLLGLIFPEK